ncbi:alpha/beta hydrolase fold domain-containing protein [Planctomycetota bacterium]
MTKRLLLTAFVLVWTASTAWALPDSTTDERLKRLLDRFPSADANGDGVLTLEEAKAFRQARKNRRPGRRKGPEPTRPNVRYGEHERNVLDLWQAPSESPTALVVFIHGGGFKGGDKGLARSRHGALIQRCLSSGVSFASLNYRLLGDGVALPDCLRDSARAIQYLRHQAGELNLDKTRIGAFGSSAGAGTSMWLAFHDELADPNAEDPVLRESSRLSVAGSMAGQCTYDVMQWEDLIGSYPGNGTFPTDDAMRLYGVDSSEQLETDEVIRIRADVDMLGLLTGDDAPVFLIAGGANTEARNRGHYVHHPRHSILIRDKAGEVGVESQLVLQGRGRTPPGKNPPQALLDFFFKHLGVAEQPPSQGPSQQPESELR